MNILMELKLLFLNHILVAIFQLCTILHPPKPKGNKHHIAFMLKSLNHCMFFYRHAFALFQRAMHLLAFLNTINLHNIVGVFCI